jgi:hypothetical protein
MNSSILKTEAQYQDFIKSEIEVCRDLLQKIKENNGKGRGENADDLIRKVASFDKDRIYDYISDEIDNDPEVRVQIGEILTNIVTRALGGVYDEF